MTAVCNPIAEAVAPLKIEAVNQAEVAARGQVAWAEHLLAENDGHANAAAPYPKSNQATVAQYKIGVEKYRFIHSLIQADPDRRSRGWMGDPFYAVMDPDRVEAYVESVREQAAAHYDGYVAKLTGKIGLEVAAATLSYQSGLWSHSKLLIVKISGEVEEWTTRIILNRSVYGKVFNQWPARRSR